MKRIMNYLRLNIKKLFTLRASPHQIALGVAIGIFIGIFPTLGLGAVFIGLLALFIKFNVPAALMGTLAGNPLLAPVWIALSCLVARINIKDIKSPEDTMLQAFLNLSDVLLKFLIGNSIVSLIAAVLAYVVIRQGIRMYRAKRAKV